MFFGRVDPHAPCKSVEILQRSIAVQMEPFRAGTPFAGGFRLQIGMKIVIGKVLSRSVFVHGIVFPRKYCLDSCRVCLLINALFYRLFFRITYFRPAFIVQHTWRVIGIDHRYHAFKGLDFRSHYCISFTCVLMKLISVSSSPYFA